jgi:uncharacterized membrane protein
MNAVEKVAWTELTVSILAVIVALALYPWLGQGALAGFGLLGLLGITPLFLRRRGNQVVRDERDVEIEKVSSWFGFGTTWIVMLLSLVAVTLWHAHLQRDVPTGLLSALIWIQFALCYAIKGAASLIQYRGISRAA